MKNSLIFTGVSLVFSVETMVISMVNFMMNHARFIWNISEGETVSSTKSTVFQVFYAFEP